MRDRGRTVRGWRERWRDGRKERDGRRRERQWEGGVREAEREVQV